MKTIGLLGGMSWESTVAYYRLINEGVKNALGGLHSAKIAMYSIDFEPMEKMQKSGDWDAAAQILVDAAIGVQAAGADFLLICTNTMHKSAPAIEAAVDIPLLHIADATAEVLLADDIQTVGLLGTAFTMEQDFYKGRLEDKYGLTVVTPDDRGRADVHRVIYEELCQGIIEAQSKQRYLTVIDELRQSGAQAVILGCTEIGLLVQQADTTVPLYDTTALHASKAVEVALCET
jgi:aspartate racemase